MVTLLLSELSYILQNLGNWEKVTSELRETLAHVLSFAGQVDDGQR